MPSITTSRGSPTTTIERVDSRSALTEAGIAIDLERVETNFVQIDLDPLGLERTTALSALREAGVGLSATIHPTVIRAVTHLDITDEDIDRAAELIPRALGVAARVATG